MYNVFSKVKPNKCQKVVIDMKKVFSTKMINTGGRNGEVHSPDNSFEMTIVAPGHKVAGATNPE